MCVKENGKLSNDNQRLQEISDRYDRVVRILGSETVEDVVQQDIKEQRNWKSSVEWNKCQREAF